MIQSLVLPPPLSFFLLPFNAYVADCHIRMCHVCHYCLGLAKLVFDRLCNLLFFFFCNKKVGNLTLKSTMAIQSRSTKHVKGKPNNEERGWSAQEARKRIQRRVSGPMIAVKAQLDLFQYQKFVCAQAISSGKEIFTKYQPRVLDVRNYSRTL